MTNLSGSVTATVRLESTLNLEDQPNHQMQICEVRGKQQSPDAKWNNSILSYWGMADLQSGSGVQRGYYVNEHQDGDRDFGSYEGRITVNGSDVTLEGKFIFTGGTGKLKGIRGSGSYKGKMISPTEIQMNWSGAYEVASGAGQAA